MTISILNDEDLANNSATRIPVVLCLDTSGSMDAIESGEYTQTGQTTIKDGKKYNLVTGNNVKTRMNLLNDAVSAFYQAVNTDESTRYGFDIGIVTFGADGVKQQQDFQQIWKEGVQSPKFEVNFDDGDNGTPLGQGVDLSLTGLEARKDQYQNAAGVGYYQPWLIIVSDGQPDDDNSPEYISIVQECLDMQKNGKLSVILIGVGEEDFSKLSHFRVDKKVLITPTAEVLKKVFVFISQSISSSTRSSIPNQTNTNPAVDLDDIAEDLTAEGVSIQIQDYSYDED
jgi:uncharacterized protein YegL